MYEDVTGLESCLEAVSRGEPVEEVLSRYPEQEAELRRLLKAAGLLSVAGQAMEPSDASLERIKNRLMDALDEEDRRRAQGSA